MASQHYKNLKEAKKLIGKLPENILEAVLEKIPIEFSVLDSDDKVLGWNKHETRIFKRPTAVLEKRESSFLD